MSSLPAGWSQKESKSHAGRVYYINSVTGETTWDFPTTAANAPAEEQVQVFHILKKHCGSRRPASWRNPQINQSKEESIQQIMAYKNELQQLQSAQGFDRMFQRFQEIAFQESDCGSHERGGDLGLFGRGQMQKPFEMASFGLKVGELSEIVDTDSGIHVLVRIR